MPDQLLDPGEVALRLGLNKGDVLRLIHAGKIPAKKLVARGTGARPRLRVRESELRAFIDGLEDADSDRPHVKAPKRDRAMRVPTAAKAYY